MHLRLLLLSCLIPSISFGQGETIGLLHHTPDVSEGYTLFSPSTNDRVYLIDNCGEKINEWTFSEGPGLTCYLLQNGNLLRSGQDSLEIRDWNNNLVWSYAMNDNGLPQHHDIEPLPNGNVLTLIRQIVTDVDAIDAGRDPAFAAATIRMERIVELEPVGSNGANIVWEWRFMDHLIQDFDSTKSNFGVVEQHPELIDFNYDNGQSNNWIHANAVEYNPVLDQVMISSRQLSEIYIIDHSTTTAEAAGHSGGNSGMGGDLLWRWGNPAVYRQGGPADRKLFFQHDPKWVRQGYPDEGKISIFNNDADSTGAFSAVGLIEPTFLSNAYTMTNNRFDPADFDWTWSGSILGIAVDQNSRCGAQSQANGNMMFCETVLGRFSEIDKMGNHAWSYVNPTGPGGVPYTQGAIPASNATFRAEKYPASYPGFDGLTLLPSGTIENMNSISDTCSITTGLTDVSVSVGLVNPSANGMIRFTESITSDLIEIRSANGQLVHQEHRFAGNVIQADLAEGLYLLRMKHNGRAHTFKVLMR